MQVVTLGGDRIDDFIAYCKEHRYEHDPSFLSDEELEKFKNGRDVPACLLIDEDGRIRGASFLVIFSAEKKGRFGIIHSEITAVKAYRMLVDEMVGRTRGLDNLYLFLPEEKDDVREIFSELGFAIERYSWVLFRPLEDDIQASFPAGYTLRPLKEKSDAGDWCRIIDISFADIAGHVACDEDKIAEELASRYYLEGGMLFLEYQGSPVGLVQITEDEETGDAYIGPIAVLPSHQGRRLGTNLLLTGLSFARERGYEQAWLSVNAENKKAADLYLRQGFKKDLVVVCYNKAI